MRPVEAQPSPRPWYREPWPWFLMALPVTAIVAGLITLAIAIRTEDGLVAEDYYRQGLAINRQLQREAHARELGLRAEVVFDGPRIAVTLSGTAPSALTLRLVHPMRAGGDQSVSLRRVGAREYAGRYEPTRGGSRRLLLEDPGRTWRIAGEWDGRGRAAHLAPDR